MPSNFLACLLLLNMALPVIGISCYGYNAYRNTPTVQHNKNFCMAIYDVANEEGTFSGVDRNPIKAEKLKWDFNLGKDCQMQKTRLREDEEWQVVYTCLCFSSMCNFPFSFQEFKNRNYTLAPVPSKIDSVW
ncbi:hypothetical protein CAEBREN_15688 [Caenorhabditis brenneri]|uniref:Uncharacterized protein n=1 Tax=Caenorhabditis brenneri TaxID=135651 RepID=G0P2G8_CAEBE|nr:hypothetical protein CAEBREN_15688 [Caenorhabditis brenneri]